MLVGTDEGVPADPVSDGAERQLRVRCDGWQVNTGETLLRQLRSSHAPLERESCIAVAVQQPQGPVRKSGWTGV